MDDIVERLRGFKSAAAQSWAHEAADEIESLRAQLAEVTRERDEYAERRCEVCGYAEHHREHTGCLRKQLLATQAHAASLQKVIQSLKEQLSVH